MLYRKGARGAISIFLVIILVPMITVSSLFVDASKLILANSVAESAGDLALNTALTHYDTQLKDLYGLFATAQDTEDLYTKLEDYYRTCITSAGVSEADANSYVDQIMASLGSVDSTGTSDLLEMELVDFTATKVKDASLANPMILKNQIVQFMKYRAPINTGLSFLNALESFSTLDKQTELVEKRTEYYKAQQTVMEKLQSAWKHIAKYENLEFLKDNDPVLYFNSMKDKVNAYEATYKVVNSDTIKNLYDTQNYVDYQASITQNPAVMVSSPSRVYTQEAVWHFSYPLPLGDFTTYTTYNLDALPTANQIASLMNNFYANYNTMDSYKAELQSPTAPADAYEMQYLVQNMRSGELLQYTSGLMNVYTTYQSIKHAKIWVDGYDVLIEQAKAKAEAQKDDEDAPLVVIPTTTTTDVLNTNIVVKGKQGTVLQHFTDITNLFDTTMSANANTLAYFSAVSERVKGNSDTSITNQTVGDISKEIKHYVEVLEKAKAELDAAVEDLKSAKRDIESGGALENAKTAWEQKANDSEIKGTSIAKQDLSEIKNLDEFLNAEDIQPLIDQMTTISTNIETTLSALREYKYNEKFLGDIENYNSLKNVLKNKYGHAALTTVPISESELNKTVETYFVWNNGNVDVRWVDNQQTSPKLQGSGTNTTRFYSYLHHNFKDVVVVDDTVVTKEDKAAGKDTYESIKKKSNEEAKKDATAANNGNITSAKEISSLAYYPSKDKEVLSTPHADIVTDETAVGATSDSLDKMFANLSVALIGMGTDLRDKLYISDYIMSMFSYDTIEKEYQVKNPDKGTTDLQTLTLIPINKTNNYVYGKEVEYIIYGGSNSDNVGSAYGSIYGIRLGFNLIYAFMDSEIRDTAFAMATPISAATLGVIPVPLIQAAIIIGIACCESGVDLAKLQSGETVPLFKNKKTWNISITGFIEFAKSTGKELAKDAAEYVVDEGVKKLNELMDLTDEELTTYMKKYEGEITAYLDNTYNTLITQHANIAIQKLTTLATNALNYPDLTLEQQKNFVQQGLNTWLDEEAIGVDTENDITYIVKKAAVQYIQTNCIEKMLTAISSSKDTATTSIENAGYIVLDQVDSIRKNIVENIVKQNQKLITYKDEMFKKVNESIGKGADELKKTLNKEIDGLLGGGTEVIEDKTSGATLAAFAYSDYMRLFLMIGLYTDEGGILIRTADIMQSNMLLKDKQYRLDEAVAYVEIKTTIEVKPTLLDLPLFNGIEANPFKDGKGYIFEYKDIRGY